MSLHGFVFPALTRLARRQGVGYHMYCTPTQLSRTRTCCTTYSRTPAASIFTHRASPSLVLPSRATAWPGPPRCVPRGASATVYCAIPVSASIALSTRDLTATATIYLPCLCMHILRTWRACMYAPTEDKPDDRRIIRLTQSSHRTASPPACVPLSKLPRRAGYLPGHRLGVLIDPHTYI